MNNTSQTWHSTRNFKSKSWCSGTTEEDEEEDFQMVPLDDEHWHNEEAADRTLCIHEHALPHRLCLYLCPYANYLLPSYVETMDLSDISNFEDIMIMSSDEDIPAPEDPPYWKNSALH